MDERQYRLTKHIINTDFDKAYEIVRNLSEEELEELMLDIGSRTMNLTVYSFMNYLLQLNETSSFHSVTSLLMAFSLCHMEGAYTISLHHARKAIKLAPQDVTYYEFILFFEGNPYVFLSKEEITATHERIKELSNE